MTGFDYIWTLAGGILGGFIWMGILVAVFRDRPEANALAFKAMVLLFVMSVILSTAFPALALEPRRGQLVTIGYLLVMAWFWKSRRLEIVARQPLTSERR